MARSRGELKIHDILEFAGLKYKEEYSFADLVGFNNRVLRFDFAVFNDDDTLDFLIEYQGVQHYYAKDKFGGPAGLRKQQTYDRMKREYCQSHNIPLVIIPYWDEGIVNYDYIMKMAGY